MTAVDAPSATGGERLCAYRACRDVLPPPTGRPGNRPKYCQDGRTWGNGLTCKAAEAAYLAVESLQGDSPVPPDVEELGQRLDDVTGPLQGVLDAVIMVRGRLDEEVLAAHAAREAAVQQAAADRGARQAAEDDAAAARAAAAEARSRAAEADEQRGSAVRARDRAVAAAAAAERAQARADGQRVALEQRVQRAEQLAAESAASAAGLREELAERTASLRAAEDALQVERDRARELLAGHREELAARDDRHQRKLAELRTAQDQAVAELRDRHAAELQAARAERETAIAQLAADHAEQLAELNRRLGAAEHELEGLRTAVADAEDVETE